MSTPLVPVQSIPAGSTAVANGTPLNAGVARANWSAQVTAAAGTTGGVVTLQLSNDGVNFWNAGTTTTSAAGTAAITSTNTAVYARASITTAITGGSVAASVVGA